MEVNALNAVSYYTHLPFFVRNFDLLGPFCAKIADELISPRAPGHVLVLLQTAEAMGLNRKEVLEDPYLPAARAINDFCHKIFIDGSSAVLTKDPTKTEYGLALGAVGSGNTGTIAVKVTGY